MIKTSISFLLIFCSIVSFGQRRNKKKSRKKNKASQQRAENAVSNYLNEKFKADTYYAYEFGDLYKNTPNEITYVSKLKRERDSLIKIDSNHSELGSYNRMIDLQLKTIKDKKLYSTYQIDHFYTIKKFIEQPVLYHATFTLYPDGKVKDVNTHLEYELTNVEDDYYFHYYKRYPFINGNSMEDKAFNLKTYNYIDGLYRNETVDKKAAISTLITTTQVIAKTGYYDTTFIAQQLASRYLCKKNDIDNLTNPSFTEVQPIMDSTNLIGYKLFVLHTNKEKKEELFYFEYDYNYIIRNVLPVEPPFEQYFIK